MCELVLCSIAVLDQLMKLSAQIADCFGKLFLIKLFKFLCQLLPAHQDASKGSLVCFRSAFNAFLKLSGFLSQPRHVKIQRLPATGNFVQLFLIRFEIIATAIAQRL